MCFCCIFNDLSPCRFIQRQTQLLLILGGYQIKLGSVNFRLPDVSCNCFISCCLLPQQTSACQPRQKASICSRYKNNPIQSSVSDPAGKVNNINKVETCLFQRPVEGHRLPLGEPTNIAQWRSQEVEVGGGKIAKSPPLPSPSPSPPPPSPLPLPPSLANS